MNDRESRRCTAGPGVPPPRETLGGYVLGALDPMETDRTAAHLAECEGCRAEYLDLLDLLPLLAVITEQEAVTGPVRPHPDTLEKVLSARSVAETGTPGPPPGPAVPLRGTSALGGPAATVAGAAVGPAVRSRRRPRDSRPPSSGTQPRRRNLVLAIGAAAVVGALVVAGALGLGRGQSSPPQLTAWSASAAATYTKGAEIAASVRVTTNTANSGSLITLTLTGVPTGYSCKMVMFGTDGTRQTSHEWTAPSAGTFSIPGTSTMTPKDIEDIEVQLPDGSVLAQLNQP